MKLNWSNKEKQWIYIPLIVAAVYVVAIVIGNYIGQKLSFALWGDYFVDETAYIDTLIHSLLCGVITFCILKMNGLLNIASKRQGSIKVGVLSFFGILFFSSAIYSFVEIAHAEDSSAWDSVENVNIYLKILVLVIITPIAEELVFRGAFFGSLRSRYGFFISACISSALFASVHDIGIGMITIFATGMFLCLAYEKTGGLFVGMIIHIINNSFAVIPSSDTDGPTQADLTAQIIFAIVQLAVAFFIFYLYVFKGGKL